MIFDFDFDFFFLLFDNLILINFDKFCIIRTTCPHFFLKVIVDFLTSMQLRAQNTTLLSKVRRRFFQILWPSQKTQTLIDFHILFFCISGIDHHITSASAAAAAAAAASSAAAAAAAGYPPHFTPHHHGHSAHHHNSTISSQFSALLGASSAGYLLTSESKTMPIF